MKTTLAEAKLSLWNELSTRHGRNYRKWYEALKKERHWRRLPKIQRQAVEETLRNLEFILESRKRKRRIRQKSLVEFGFPSSIPTTLKLDKNKKL